MKKIKKFEEISPLETLLLREKLGLKRFKKTRSRSGEKREMLLKLALKRIVEAEKDDYLPVGVKRRKVKV